MHILLIYSTISDFFSTLDGRTYCIANRIFFSPSPFESLFVCLNVNFIIECGRDTFHTCKYEDGTQWSLAVFCETTTETWREPEVERRKKKKNYSKIMKLANRQRLHNFLYMQNGSIWMLFVFFLLVWKCMVV